MRGYFGIGVAGISKAMNVGTIMRSAHAFGASFLFTVGAAYEKDEGRKSDTSAAWEHLPFYEFAGIADLTLPHDCTLVGIEIVDDAIALPTFRHPRRAAYVFGPERGGLPAGLVTRCAHVVKIPTRFSVNVGIAAAIVMYDRCLSLGRYPPRPVGPGGPTEALPAHVFGGPLFRTRRHEDGG